MTMMMLMMMMTMPMIKGRDGCPGRSIVQDSGKGGACQWPVSLIDNPHHHHHHHDYYDDDQDQDHNVNDDEDEDVSNDVDECDDKKEPVSALKNINTISSFFCYTKISGSYKNMLVH